MKIHEICPCGAEIEVYFSTATSVYKQQEQDEYVKKVLENWEGVHNKHAKTGPSLQVQNPPIPAPSKSAEARSEELQTSSSLHADAVGEDEDSDRLGGDASPQIRGEESPDRVSPERRRRLENSVEDTPA